jgi:hypothetical protein
MVLTRDSIQLPRRCRGARRGSWPTAACTYCAMFPNKSCFIFLVIENHNKIYNNFLFFNKMNNQI